LPLSSHGDNAEIIASRKVKPAELRFDFVDVERKAEAIETRMRKKQKKVLVIDEGLLLYTRTSDARPWACLKSTAFTTATPYQDYARSPVPTRCSKYGPEKAKIWNLTARTSSWRKKARKDCVLRHISRNAPDHALFKFLDLNSFRSIFSGSTSKR